MKFYCRRELLFQHSNELEASILKLLTSEQPRTQVNEKGLRNTQTSSNDSLVPSGLSGGGFPRAGRPDESRDGRKGERRLRDYPSPVPTGVHRSQWCELANRRPDPSTSPMFRRSRNRDCGSESHSRADYKAWPRASKHDDRIIIGHIEHRRIERSYLNEASGLDHIHVAVRRQISIAARLLPHPLHSIHDLRALAKNGVTKLLGPCRLSRHHVEH